MQTSYSLLMSLPDSAEEGSLCGEPLRDAKTEGEKVVATGGRSYITARVADTAARLSRNPSDDARGRERCVV